MRVAKGKNVTLHDMRQVKRFAHELQLAAKLERDGHVAGCVKLQVFESYPCTCPRGFGPAMKGGLGDS